MSAIVHDGNVLNPLWKVGCAASWLQCYNEDGDDIDEGDDNGDEDVDDNNNPWGKVVPSRLLEVEKPTSGERATSCLPRVSWENQLNPHYGQIIFNHLELIFRNWWDGSKSRMNIGLK